MSWSRYPKYRDSGVEWLGQFPAHWVITAVRDLAREGRDTFVDGDWIESPFITDEGIRLIQTGNIGVGLYREQGFRYISEETFKQLRCTEIEPGDILICRLAEPVGRACVAPRLGPRMITSVDVCIVKPHAAVDPQFIAYLFSAAQYLNFMESQCRGGTRDRVTRSFLGAVRIGLPAIEEQLHLRRFLDIEVCKIDALITEQEQLIELLKEKRQAVISQAVTKGLRPEASSKQSGSEWIGTVPAHWSSKRLRYLFRQEKRQGHATEQVLSVYRDYGVIPKDSRDDNMNKTPEDLSVYQLVEPGDLVVNKMKAWQGSLGVSAFKGITSPDYVVFTPQHCEYASFVHLLLRSSVMVSAYRGISNGIRLAQWRLEPEPFLSLQVHMPPVDEQMQIVRFIEEQVSRLDALITEAQVATVLLRERRTGLISSVVTGQIDVRGYAATRAA